VCRPLMRTNHEMFNRKKNPTLAAFGPEAAIRVSVVL
jgi:hypothetical protein